MGRGCGGGGLRILPHKSWNVYGRKNIEKVRADEAVHAESEAKLAASSRRNESEWKLQQMRNRVQQRSEYQRGVKRPFSHEGGEEEEEEDDAEHPRRRFRYDEGELHADGAASSNQSRFSTATTSSSAPTPTAARFVVQQEDDSTPMEENGNAASSSSAAPLAPAAQHINLFYDVEKTAQNAEINRQKAAESAQKELSHARKVAPVSLFVESLRDEETLSATGFDSLRPWYAASEDQREASRIRRVEASKKQVRIKRREDGQGVRLLVNRTGEIIHTDVDPLEEMKQNLRHLEKYESTKQTSASKPVVNSTSVPIFHIVDPPAAESVLGIQDVIAAARVQAAARLAPNPTSSFRQPLPAADTTQSSSSVPPPRISRWSETKVVSTDLPLPSSNLSIPIRPLFAAASTLNDQINQPNIHDSSSMVLPKPRVDVISISSASSASSSNSDSSASSDNSSDSDSSSSSSRKKSRRRDSQRSHKHKKRKKEKKSKKDKKKHRSRSKDRKQEKSRKEKRQRSDSKSKDRRSSSKSDRNETKKQIDIPSSSSSFNANAPFFDPSFQLKSLAELRAERVQREKAEHEKAAALLQVPASATFDRNSIRQREYKDTELYAKRR